MDALKSLSTGRTIAKQDRQGKALASTAFSVANGNAPAPVEDSYGE